MKVTKYIIIVGDPAKNHAIGYLLEKLGGEFLEFATSDYIIVHCSDEEIFHSKISRLGNRNFHNIAIVIFGCFFQDNVGQMSIESIRQVSPGCPTLELSRLGSLNFVTHALEKGVTEYFSGERPLNELPVRVKYLIRSREKSEILIAQNSDNILEIQSIGSNFRRITLDAEISSKVGILTNELVDLIEAVKGDNSLLGEILKKQLLATLQALSSELTGEYVDADSLEKKATTLSKLGEKASSEALSKGLGNIFKRVSDLIFDFLSNI